MAMVTLTNQKYCNEGTWVGVAISLAGVVAGIFLGEAVNSLERASMMTAWFVTIAAFWFGVKIFFIAFKHKHFTLGAAVLATWAANLSFSLSLQPEPLVDMLFDIATFFCLIVMLKYAEDHVMNFGNMKYGRRNDDWYVCEKCKEPRQNYSRDEQ